MATETNWSGTIGTAGTAISTAADIYTSINNGKIKAIQMEIEATNKEAEAKTMDSQSRINNMDTMSKLSALDTQYTAQLAAIDANHSAVTEQGQMAVASQGRTLDSLDRVQENDAQNLEKDKALSLLNKQGAEAGIKGQRDVQKIQSQSGAETLRSGAEISRLNGDIYKAQGGVDASTSLLKGISTLAKNDAFNKKTYRKEV